MRSPGLFLAALIGVFASLVSSTALTYKLTAGEKSCFYAWVNENGVKVAFYFAVSSPSLHTFARQCAHPISAGAVWRLLRR